MYDLDTNGDSMQIDKQKNILLMETQQINGFIFCT